MNTIYNTIQITLKLTLNTLVINNIHNIDNIIIAIQAFIVYDICEN